MNTSLHHALSAYTRRGVDRLTRRSFMRQSLAVGSAMLLSARSASGRRYSAGRRVIVVGAGFAGLACAHELTTAGYDVEVVEARDRFGGRVHTLTDLVPGKTVEAGGEFIGSNHPTWLAYAERFKLPLIEVPEPRDLASPVMLNGKQLSKLAVIALFQQIEAVYARLTEAARALDADAPWTMPDARTLDALSLSGWLDRQEITPLVRRAIETEFLSYSGVPTTHDSFLGTLTVIKGGGLEKYWTENEAFHCTGGNHQLARRLLERIGEGHLHLRAPVAHIAVTSDRAKVVTQSGVTYEADDVVLAIPPSTWSHIRFEPDLPAELETQMGKNVKFLVTVRDAFWTRSELPPTSMSDGPCGYTWNATEGQPGGPEQCLVAFAGGAAAENLCRLTAPERQRVMTADVATRFADFPKAIASTQFVDWPNQKWTRGSYSTAAPGQVTRQGPVLAAGLGRLHFAGEHVCLKFAGFMEGALNSGVTVARRLAVRDGLAN